MFNYTHIHSTIINDLPLETVCGFNDKNKIICGVVNYNNPKDLMVFNTLDTFNYNGKFINIGNTIYYIGINGDTRKISVSLHSNVRIYIKKYCI